MVSVRTAVINDPGFPKIDIDRDELCENTSLLVQVGHFPSMTVTFALARMGDAEAGYVAKILVFVLSRRHR